jgi:hypothetical protein
MKDADTEDHAAIRAVATDYARGWYEGDPARMARALHPSLVKRTIAPDAKGGWTVGRTATRDLMIQWTREGEGTAVPGERIYETRILDVFRDIATVRCVSAAYVDYLHLARFGAEEWKIVNVLWQYREGDEEAVG